MLGRFRTIGQESEGEDGLGILQHSSIFSEPSPREKYCSLTSLQTWLLGASITGVRDPHRIFDFKRIFKVTPVTCNIFWITDVVMLGKLLYKNSNGLGREVSVCAGAERERSSPWTRD